MLAPIAAMVGETLSHYRIHSLIGAGGMGEVYKAEDTRLKRAVAVKMLPHALLQDPEARQRLVAEAQAASALDHPNICTIYEVDEAPDGRVFLAMAYYEGETLRERIARGPLPLAEALEIATQIVSGVAAAHDAGIVHRDIKPANIFLSTRGGAHGPAVKLLDFGIAKVRGQTALTRTGTTVGTVAYMSPEHLAGHAIDARADVWSLGVVLYEMFAGRLPHAATHELAMLRAIADGEPRRIRDDRPDLPAAVAAIVDRALQKAATARYAHAGEMLADLEAAQAPAAAASPAAAPRARRARWVAAALALLALAGAGLWFGVRAARARETSAAVAEIRGMVEREEHSRALRALHTLPAGIAAAPEMERVRAELFLPLSIESEPPGAEVSFQPYEDPDGPWVHLGKTPIETRGQQGAYRWRVTAAGFETFEGSGLAPNAFGSLRFVLRPAGTTPEGMVAVGGGGIPNLPGVRIPPFFIDRFEVTNRQFKQFVDAGGYTRAEYWTEPVLVDGGAQSFEASRALFRDSTGRPGPATWELGAYPEGQDDWPVRGVSWYEAAAYARFAGKALPTVYHWRLAAAYGIHSHILEWSNFTGKGPARVGEFKGLGPFGTYDMAGNVKEWCVNAVGGDPRGERRYVLGGGWNEPNYLYPQSDARAPLDRSENIGLRLIQPADDAAVPARAFAPVERLTRDYSRETPVSDSVFETYRRLYAYDRTNLAAEVESVDDSSPDWRVERVSYDAGYGGERIPAYLFLPRRGTPPYQAVVYFPHAGGLALDSFQQAEMSYLGFLVKAGRALLFPMYKGTYERRLRAPIPGPVARRDLVIQQVRDVGRSTDYLRTRPDIDADRVAYFGVSMGANLAPIILAVGPPFSAAVLWSGGLPSSTVPAEFDPINFAPRVSTPVLMLNGRDDFTSPVETSQEPLFERLGTPAEHKRRGLYPGGHVFPFSRMIKDSLDWLDRYLGVPP